MCGLVGFLSLGAWVRLEAARPILSRMADAVITRGPDDAGYWSDKAGIALGHRRLSVLDLSPAGAQPMKSACGRYVVVFNGEIYNHVELRRELERQSLGTLLCEDGELQKPKSVGQPNRLEVTDKSMTTSGRAPAPLSALAAALGGRAANGVTKTGVASELYRKDHSGLSGEKFNAGGALLARHRSLADFATAQLSWRGHSDTETLLAGFAAWGIRPTIERCIGMFAFAVWDRAERVLTLGRDRLGEKPLYYGWQGRGDDACFLFGSDLRALKRHPVFEAQINRDALALYMRHSVVPAPHSIYRGIRKLLPGHLLRVSLMQREPRLEQYWSLPQVAEEGVADPFEGSEDEAAEALEKLLKDAVRQQMIADVPLGAFLSGGVDSSIVVALMQAQSSRPIKTFSIGFNEEAYNEAVHAKAVAEHLGTDHTELYVTPQQALNVIPRLPVLYSEPFSDSSQIPTFLVAHLARHNVTVALSGDAGDELFGGYSRYLRTQRMWNIVKPIPKWIRSGLAPCLLNASRFPLGRLKIKTKQTASLLSAKIIDDFYIDRVTHWEPLGLVLGAKEPSTHLLGNPLMLAGLDGVQRMMALDTITYLPDDILVKVDRAAMGVSLETRVPFLDHRIVEFAWRIPQRMKFSDGIGKRILRQVLYRHVPKALVERPKMGFGVPIDTWLRGPLRDWAESLLEESRLGREGFFNPGPIRKKWNEHLSGRRNWQYHLWDVLMFQAWLETYNIKERETV